MYEMFNKIDPRLGGRYKTIETNIKAKSNSFYESLLALLEGLARLIAIEQQIPVDSEYDTLIGIIRVKELDIWSLFSQSYKPTATFLPAEVPNAIYRAKT